MRPKRGWDRKLKQVYKKIIAVMIIAMFLFYFVIAFARFFMNL
jgi:hypothetical protein